MFLDVRLQDHSSIITSYTLATQLRLSIALSYFFVEDDHAPLRFRQNNLCWTAHQWREADLQDACNPGWILLVEIHFKRKLIAKYVQWPRSAVTDGGSMHGHGKGYQE